MKKVANSYLVKSRSLIRSVIFFLTSRKAGLERSAAHACSCRGSDCSYSRSTGSAKTTSASIEEA